MQNVRINRVRARAGRLGLAILLTAGLSVAAACDSSEERAESHYQSGLALLEEGDVERALIEFRNVFELNSTHEGARAAYARALHDRGQLNEAYGEYLRLVEQYPENVEGQRALADIAATTQNWSDAEIHVAKALALAPDDILMLSIDNAVDYFNAVKAREDEGQQAAIVKAQALIADDNGLKNARNVLIDNLLRKQDWYAALDAIDDGLAVDPDQKGLYSIRLGILQQIGDLNGIDAQLRDLMERFPQERGVYKQTLVRFLIKQKKLDEAETFIRAEAERDDASPDDRVFLISFLEQMRGQEAALAEVEAQLAAGIADSATFRSMRAKLRFQMGDVDSAIAEMEDLTANAERTDQTRGFEVDLARMLFQEDNAVGARALVEKVLAEDPAQPDAVKLKANWLIDDDETADAIVMLRDALNDSPDDADIMSLMARAYEREGNQDLRSEMLALAVQASGKAPAESLRYASSLADNDNLLAAEGILIDALRLTPQNPALLSALGDVYTRLEDWSRTDDVIAALGALDDPNARRQAAELTARKLTGQNRSEELTALLEGLENDPALGKSAQYALLRNRLETSGPEAAETYLNELLAQNPEDPTLRFMKGGFLAEAEEITEAEEQFRALVAENPKYANVWIALYRMKQQAGDLDGANGVLEEALAELPTNGTLLWAKAGEYERAGDLDAAIEIYETMYAVNSDSLIVANNLASLLATHRGDDESLQRAYTVARRLRDSNVPAFQDTYGWITHRRGSYEAAQDHLRAAAQGLPRDVTVQYHLAANLAALDLTEEALAQFQKVRAMINPDNPPPFATDVDSEIQKLSQLPAGD
ncbi:tetratricopeptide repeat protein [Sedimentitalea todarodis]|uniref:Tetratricopeptide repeat protein n=1 Tax=Sedimentitalea todarodis TaxID=1631240 RepID=A0ABU3VJ10_9RHOB|nr:tetratricopeptide repeat protein [Sedimentitalea todarodis]MDU9006140.1 tetratricopeptide repeat protein [Sedimentitalea todarodis]